AVARPERLPRKAPQVRRDPKETGVTQGLGGLRVIAERKATGEQRGALVLTARTETTGPTVPMVPADPREIRDRKGTPALLVPRVTEVNGVPRVRLVNPDHRESEAPRGRLPSPSASRISESTTSVPRTQKPTSTTPVLRGDVMAARITQGQFEQQVKNARKQWPFIEDIERKHGMPAGFLYAVGSRETNLRNILGDGGNGVGVWQRDKRWWPIDNSYLKDVRKQAQDAAELLSANKRALGDWRKAASAYNAGLSAVQKALKAGKSADSVTTGRDYGSDVMSRLAFYKPAVKASKGATTTVAKSKSTGYLTDLAAIARRTGYPVVEQPGWRTRGHGSFRGVRSVIAHHDAARQSPTTFNTIVQNGRPGLPGPLSQFALRRDGTIHVVAAGVSWHAGNNINDALYGN